MTRIVPPWIYQSRDGRDFVVLGGREYPVDKDKPPIYTLVPYLKAHLPSGWLESVGVSHPLSKWIRECESFLAEFASRDHRTDEYRDILRADSQALLVTAYDMFSLEDDSYLQEKLVGRMLHPDQFQGALHELSVAATMMRAGFSLDFADDSDCSTTHPEFVATHRRTGTRIAVEAKSIHRLGVLGSSSGAPVPTMETVKAERVAVDVCRQVRRALKQAPTSLPLFVFVDLKLPPQVAEAISEPLRREIGSSLQDLETPGFDLNGVRVGRRLTLVNVTNTPMHMGEERHSQGDALSFWFFPNRDECRYPDALGVIDDVKSSMNIYGTVAV